jgi:hypothetical protein
LTVNLSDNLIRIMGIEVRSQMMYKKAAVVVSVGIFFAGVLAGCKSEPPPPPPPKPAPARREAPIARPAPPVIPARPLTRGILELIEKSSYETRDLQYFISSTLTLEHGKGMQIDIELDPGGQGVIQEINAHEKIIIPKDTGGVLIPEPGAALPGGPRTLKICFDDVDEHTLTFRENPSDHRYYLVFREDRQYGEFTEYGSKSYRLTFDGEIPYLYVRLDERTDDRPRTRQLQGRYVSPEYSAESYIAPEPVPAAVPAAVQETVVPGRSPQPEAPAPETPVAEPAPAPEVSPAPAPQEPPPSPPEEEDEELDLEALLGL